MSEETGITVKYIYSACIITSTNDTKILHDPWFTEGVYDGSWYQFPKLEDPITAIGDVDYIYISHIHPDHYDPIFIKKYFAVYGEKKIIIADHKPNFLVGKMKADGLQAVILDNPLTIGKTEVTILPHITGSISDIDSAIIVRYYSDDKTHCIVNANDIIFEEDMRLQLKEQAGEIDVLLCGYTGAGPYPQTYFDIDDDDLTLAAERKKLSFFERYKTLIKHMNAKVNIPFAGKYILGGLLSNLNQYRGVADSVEVLAFDENAIVLADAGGEINTVDLTPSATRTEPYSQVELERRIASIAPNKMDYERLIAADEIFQLPINRLLAKAAALATSKSEYHEDYYFCFHTSANSVAVININGDKGGEFRVLPPQGITMEPRSEIFIDLRYLFGLLTNVYHWNNAEVGSQFSTRRYPDALNRQAQSFLNFLSV